MIVVGLTGSIGMGKSTTARLFGEEGAAVFDADAAVHRLYAVGGAAVEPLRERFGESIIVEGAVDRGALGALVRDNPTAFSALEDIVHPLVGQERYRFVDAAKASGCAVAVLDVPLLFETGLEALVDRVVVVSAPLDVQRERVLGRAGMTEEAFASILARQTPDHEKRAKADFVIDTSRGVDAAREQVRHILLELQHTDEA